MSEVVYKASCWDCHDFYIGITKLNTVLKLLWPLLVVNFRLGTSYFFKAWRHKNVSDIFYVPQSDIVFGIDQFRYIKIQSNTKDLNTRLWGVNEPHNSLAILQKSVRPIVTQQEVTLSELTKITAMT